jgi:hypothetical protein
MRIVHLFFREELSSSLTLCKAAFRFNQRFWIGLALHIILTFARVLLLLPAMAKAESGTIAWRV